MRSKETTRTDGRRTIRTDGRAQTAQDFAIGVGIFLVAVTFVIGFFPQMVAVYDAKSGARDASLADRVASTVLSDITDEGAQNTIDVDEAAPYFQNQLSASNVRTTLTIPQTKFVNVTIRSVGSNNVVTTAGGVRLDGGHSYDGQPALTLTRLVTVSDAENPSLCNPACRLVVRVW